MSGKLRRHRSIFTPAFCVSFLSIPLVTWTVINFLCNHPGRSIEIAASQENLNENGIHKDRAAPVVPNGYESVNSAAEHNVIEYLTDVESEQQVLEYAEDEFLAKVLKTVDFLKVDLLVSRTNESLFNYDTEIEKDLQKMRPEFGLVDAFPEVPNDVPKEVIERVIDRDAFNSILSEHIPLDRSVPENVEAG